MDPALRGAVRLEALAEQGGSQRESSLDLTGQSVRLTDAGIPNSISRQPTHYLCNEAYGHLLERFHGKAALLRIPSDRYFQEDLRRRFPMVFL